MHSRRDTLKWHPFLTSLTQVSSPQKFAGDCLKKFGLLNICVSHKHPPLDPPPHLCDLDGHQSAVADDAGTGAAAWERGSRL